MALVIKVKTFRVNNVIITIGVFRLCERVASCESLTRGDSLTGTGRVWCCGESNESKWTNFNREWDLELIWLSIRDRNAFRWDSSHGFRSEMLQRERANEGGGERKKECWSRNLFLFSTRFRNNPRRLTADVSRSNAWQTMQASDFAPKETPRRGTGRRRKMVVPSVPKINSNNGTWWRPSLWLDKI